MQGLVFGNLHFISERQTRDPKPDTLKLRRIPSLNRKRDNDAEWPEMKSNHDRRVKAEELLRVDVSDLEDASLALVTQDDKILDLQRFVRTATMRARTLPGKRWRAACRSENCSRTRQA